MTKRLFCRVANTHDFQNIGALVDPGRPVPSPPSFSRFSDSVTIKYPYGTEATYDATFNGDVDNPDVMILLPGTKEGEIPSGSELWISENAYKLLQDNTVLLYEQPNRWVIPAGELEVTGCRIDYAFTINYYQPSGLEISARIEGNFVYTAAGRTYELDPEKGAMDLCPALALLHQQLATLIADKNGELDMYFLSGDKVHVPVDAHYEAWNIFAPKGMTIVSAPGGGLTFWDTHEE